MTFLRACSVSLLLSMLFCGCLAAWAATFPTYYEVVFPDDSQAAPIWYCAPEGDEKPPKLVCLSVESVLLQTLNCDAGR